jgi:hypothetical protein
MDRHFWRITGHAGMDQIFERILPADTLSDGGIRLLLQCLMARELDINQLIDGLNQTGSDGRGPLEVIRTCGIPPEYRLVEAHIMFEAAIVSERQPDIDRTPGLAA